MPTPLDPPPGRLANGQFTVGNPGRRAGSRNRASHRMVMAILSDFERNAPELLAHLRARYPAAYFDTLVRLAPMLMAVGGDVCAEDWTDSEAAQIVYRARQVLAAAPNPHAALAELEQVLSVGPATALAAVQPAPGAEPWGDAPPQLQYSPGHGAPPAPVSTVIYGESPGARPGDETATRPPYLRWNLRAGEGARRRWPARLQPQPSSATRASACC